MRTPLQTRIAKAEQSVHLLRTAREWEIMTDPATVERLFQEAEERIPHCTSAEDVLAVLSSLPSFDPDIFNRCHTQLIALIPDDLLMECLELQEQDLRRSQIVEKARRALREGNVRWE